jgi:hypothetical protein
MNGAEVIQSCAEGRRNFSKEDLSGVDLFEADLRGANLNRANLFMADLNRADLNRADLNRADLNRADLNRANLFEADLSEADLSEADLSEANLNRTILIGTNLCGANLHSTCLGPQLLKSQRQIAKACSVRGHSGLLVYRTASSQFVGSTEYVPGHTYRAPILSFSAETECHPGIYAGTLETMRDMYADTPLVRCYVRAGDWVITAKKGCIRCAAIRVLSKVERDG